MSEMIEQADYLRILASTAPERLKPFTEEILEHVGDVQVLENRTGLVMLPYTDSVQGTAFHLGEVLMSEAHVRIDGQEGYAACLGRDLEQALAIAILDALLQQQSTASSTGNGTALRKQIRNFVADEAAAQTAADDDLLRKVEATRVEMEVF